MMTWFHRVRGYMKLPQKYLNRMEKMLGEDFGGAFLDSYDKQRYFGLRINRLKNTQKSFDKITQGKKQVSWCKSGYYYKEENRPAKDPYYFAGAYYIQEPSAMTPASALV